MLSQKRTLGSQGDYIRPTKYRFRGRMPTMRRSAPMRRIPRNTFKNGFPQTVSARLRYVTECELDAGVGGTSSFQIRANGCYDPEVSIGGHQPKGFDQFMALYRHFTVTASKIKVTPVNRTNEVNIAGAAYGVILLSGTGDLAAQTPLSLMESSPGSSKGFISAFSSVSGSFPTVATVYSKFNAKRTFGRNVISGGPFTGSVAADPTEQSIYKIWAGSITANNPPPIQFIIEVEYDVTFTERIAMNSS